MGLGELPAMTRDALLLVAIGLLILISVIAIAMAF
jgi:hypothetical protein